MVRCCCYLLDACLLGVASGALLLQLLLLLPAWSLLGHGKFKSAKRKSFRRDSTVSQKKKKKNFALFVCWFVESRKDDRREARAKRVRTWYCTVAVFNKVGGCEFDSRDLN